MEVENGQRPAAIAKLDSAASLGVLEVDRYKTMPSDLGSGERRSDVSVLIRLLLGGRLCFLQKLAQQVET